MFTTKLRKVGGSVMLAIPPAILDVLRLQAGATVGLAVEGGCLLIATNIKPRYTLAELLDATEDNPVRTEAEQEWIEAPPIGREIL